MTDLTTLQRWMSQLVRDPRAASAAVHADPAQVLVPAGEALEGKVVLPNDRMEPTQRIDVYGGAYVARLVGALRADFPGLIYALGDEGFYDVAEAYVTAHPSRHPNLIYLCTKLPEFLANRTQLTHHAFLRDLAQLEVAMTEAFHAPQADALDLERLGAVTPEEWETLVLPTNPSLRLLATNYPVNGYLQSVFDDQNPGIPERSDAYVAVYRKDYQVWRATLQEPAFATLSALAAGEPFGQALRHAGESADQVGRWFQSWTADGLLTQP